MRRTRVGLCVLSLTGCLLLSQALFGQSDRGIITGTVTDPSGGVISGVSVTATNTATSISTRTVSASGGNYTISLLRVGTYDVTAEQTGFKKYVHSGITLEVGQTLSLDIQLQVGARTETVQVTAQAEILQRDTSGRGTVISSRDIEELPIVSQGEQRNPGFYMTLAPGVTGKGTAAGTPSGSGRQLNTTVNGGQSGSTEFHLDGAVIGQGYAMSGDFRQLNFPPDVVGEFNVITLNPPAEYGQTGLGITSFTLKSGTNQFHGTAYEYLRNEALDARGFYAAKTPLNKQNEFGVTGGGPVIIPKLYNGKDRTFFYGWYAGFRLSKEAGANTLDTLPTAAMKSGDLSNLLGSKIGTDALGRPILSGGIYDPRCTRNVTAGLVDPGIPGNANCPSTGLTATATTLIRDPFPGNIIPANRIDPVAAKMFAQFANPPACPSCQGGYVNNWLTKYKNLLPANQWGAKVDHNIGNNHRLMGEYIWWKSSPITGSKWPGAISEGSISTNTQGIARLAHDWSLRPTLINHWVLGFNRYRSDSFPIGGIGWPAKLGYTGVPQSGTGSTFPELIIGGLGNVYGRGGQQYNATNDYSIDEALTWNKGRHTIKMGVSYYRFETNELGTAAQSSGLVFNAGTTSLPGGFYTDSNGFGQPLTGMGVGGFLLGLVSNGREGIVIAPVEDRSSRYAGFVQDDFKATSKLTWNLGLRYDLFLPTVNKKNQVSWWDPEVVDPSIGIKGALVFATPSRRAGAKAYTKALGPRIGLAYSLNDKTVIRAGYGILYTAGMAYRSLGNSSNQDGFSATNLVQTDGSVLTGFLPGTVPGHAGYHMILQNGWPANLFAPPTQSPSFDNGKGPMSFGAFPGGGNLPYIQNWSFTIQRRLPGEILLDLGYVGTKGTHLSSRIQNSNTVPTHYLSDSAMLYTCPLPGGAPGTTQICNHMFDPIGNTAVQALSVVQGMPVDAATGHHSPFAGFEALWGGNALLGQALRPFPQYSTDSVQNNGQMEDEAEAVGVSSYHALQIQGRKHFSQGLSFIASYTWSKTLTDSESLFNEFSGFTQDFYNRKAEKALSINDYPSNLVLSYEYQLPFGPGQRFANVGGVAGKVVGGWTIAGVHQYQSGAPQIISTIGNSFWPFIGAKSFLNRPNVVPGVPKKSAAILNGTWDPNGVGALGTTINSAAFCNPQAPTAAAGACPGPLSSGMQVQNFTLGNESRTDGDLRRFPTYNEDFSIIKRTAITERVIIEFRGDFLNIFNRTLFGFDQGGDQYGSVLQGLTSGGLGRVGGQANFPREIQFGLKIRY